MVNNQQKGIEYVEPNDLRTAVENDMENIKCYKVNTTWSQTELIKAINRNKIRNNIMTIKIKTVSR